MNQNKKQRLDELAKKIGMSQDLASLLDSDESYERFEKSIAKCLNEYTLNWSYDRLRRHKNPIRTTLKNTFHEIENFDLTSKMFRDYYGISYFCDIENQIDLLREYIQKTTIEIERSKYAEVLNKLVKSSTNSEFSKKDLVKINYVVNLLKQKHKKDIWYGCI